MKDTDVQIPSVVMIYVLYNVCVSVREGVLTTSVRLRDGCRRRPLKIPIRGSGTYRPGQTYRFDYGLTRNTPSPQDLQASDRRLASI